MQFGAMVEYHPSLRKTSRDNINLVLKSCQVFFSVMHYTRGESGKETLWSKTLKIGGDGRTRIHARRHNAKEVLTPQRSGNFIFPVAERTVKTPGGNRRLRPSTLIRDRPERGEEQGGLRGESDGLSSPTPLQDDSTQGDAEP